MGKVLVAQFAALKLHGVYLEGAVLKPNMVKNGLEGPRATAEEIATLTVTVLKRTVPSAMPGIFFLSGETTLDEDNEETATLNLNAMNKMFPSLPWAVSFSYGKALQKTAIVTWMGKDENVPAAQAALARAARRTRRRPRASTCRARARRSARRRTSPPTTRRTRASETQCRRGTLSPPSFLSLWSRRVSSC